MNPAHEIHFTIDLNHIQNVEHFAFSSRSLSFSATLSRIILFGWMAIRVLRWLKVKQRENIKFTAHIQTARNRTHRHYPKSMAIENGERRIFTHAITCMVKWVAMKHIQYVNCQLFRMIKALKTTKRIIIYFNQSNRVVFSHSAFVNFHSAKHTRSEPSEELNNRSGYETTLNLTMRLRTYKANIIFDKCT